MSSSKLEGRGGVSFGSIVRERRGSIVALLADELASAITLCHSDYCLALHLESILEDVAFYSKVSGLDAREILELILNSPRVLEAARRHGLPTRQLLEELRRPRFAGKTLGFMDVIERWVGRVEEEARRPRAGGACRGGACREAIIYGLAEAAASELERASTVEEVLLKLSNMAKLIYIVCDGDRECFRDYFTRIVSSEKLSPKLAPLACEPGKARALMRLDERFSILIPFEEHILTAAARAGCPRGRPGRRGNSVGLRLAGYLAAIAAAAILLALLLS